MCSEHVLELEENNSVWSFSEKSWENFSEIFEFPNRFFSIFLPKLLFKPHKLSKTFRSKFKKSHHPSPPLMNNNNPETPNENFSHK